jgi:putative flippase GtrA
VCLGGHYLVGNFFGFVIGTLNSFYWNNKYVFKDDSNSRNVVLTFLKTLCTYAGVGLVLNSFLLFIWIDVIGISKVIAQFVNLAVTIPLNFVINKFWAFRNKKNSVTVKKEEMGKS